MEVNNTVKDRIRLFEELFKVLITLQEDPNIQRLKIEVPEM